MSAPRLMRGRRPLPDSDPRHCLMLFPGFVTAAQSSHWWLYALGYRNGAVKIGYTANPRTRLLAQWVQGQDIAWAHLGPRFSAQCEAVAAERAAHAECRRVGSPAFGNETFIGVTKADALRALRSADELIEA